MTKKLPVALAAAALIAGGTIGLSAKSPDIAELPSMDAFNPIQRYDISHDEPLDQVEFYVRDYGVDPNDVDVAAMDHESRSDIRVMLVTLDGIQDDSVAGAQWRFDLRASGGQWMAIEAGMRRKCYRGENAGEWTRDVCP